MSPALYLELLQTRRGGWKTVAFAFAATFVLRLLLPDLGTLISILAVIPQACAGIGIGTFSEELAKGQLRFLFALPMKRQTVWWIKLASGLAGAVLVVAAALAGLWLARLLRPSDDAAGLAFLLDLLDFPPARLLPMLAAYTFYAYSAALFSVLFCRETKHAQLLNIPFAYAPFAFVGFVVVPLLGTLPSPEVLAVAFALAGLVILLGAQRLFLRRNPFDERVALWPVGLAATALAAVVFAGSALVAGTRGAERRAPRPDRVLAFSAAPDGRAVLLMAGGVPSTSSYLLDADGRVVADLGKDAMVNPAGTTWSPDGRQLFLTRTPTPTLVEAARGTFKRSPPSAVLYDRTRGALAEHSLAGIGAGEVPPMHLGWTAGRPLLLSIRYEGKGRPQHALFVMDPATGKVEGLPAIAGAGLPQLVGGRLVVYEVGAHQTEGVPPTLALLDVATRRQSRVTLPAGTEDWAMAADGRRALVATREVDDASASFRVSVLELATSATTPLLGPPEMPSATLAEVARRELGWVSLVPVRGTAWVRCDVRGDGPPRSWLLDFAKEPVALVAIAAREGTEAGGEDDSGPLGPSTASPDGRRLLRLRLPGGQGALSGSGVITIEELGPDGLREIGSHRIFGGSPAWLGSDRILFLREASDRRAMGLNELWVLDVATGAQRRFFDGEMAPQAAAAR